MESSDDMIQTTRCSESGYQHEFQHPGLPYLAFHW